MVENALVEFVHGGIGSVEEFLACAGQRSERAYAKVMGDESDQFIWKILDSRHI